MAKNEAILRPDTVTPKTVYLRKQGNFESLMEQGEAMNRSDRFTKESIQFSESFPRKLKKSRKTAIIFDNYDKRAYSKFKTIEEPLSRRLP